MDTPLSAEQFIAICRSPAARQEHASASGCAFLLVNMHSSLTQIDINQLPQCPVIGWHIGPPEDPPGVHNFAVDLVLSDQAQCDLVITQIMAQPAASTTLVQVLRHNFQQQNAQQHNVRQLNNSQDSASQNNARQYRAAGLLAESLAYSSLQHSAGFQQWLAQRQHKQVNPPSQAPAVLCQRLDNSLEISLNRPQQHNAFNEDMKTALCELLLLAHSDHTVTQVHLQGAGPSFCAGGDLSEFGQATDAGLAHISRPTRHAGELLAALTCHTRATLHGACIGAGIEIPAFADHISAHVDSRFQLPEVAMGLIPGAGGTVSIPQRIGRQRTAYMALSNRTIDAQTALSWGLIDKIIQET